jgi:dihydrodipicolinate synthase/N-acetylneuraminate lyase
MAMTASNLPAGVIADLATPLDDSGKLDESGLSRLLEHVVGAGVDGISPAGSTGEGAHLRPAQRTELVAAVRSRVPQHMPVLAGAPVRDPDEALRNLDELAEAGASAALVSVQPVYALSDPDVARVYETLAEHSAVPLVLYNIPVFTRIALPVALIAELAAHPNVLGIKDSSRDVEYLQQVLFATAGRDFRVYTGTDTLLGASLSLGAHGTIAASVNLVPELSIGIVRSHAAGDMTTVRELQERLTRVVTACRRGPAPAGWKAALSIAGICSDTMVPPASPLAAPLRDELATDLYALGVGRSTGRRRRG